MQNSDAEQAAHCSEEKFERAFRFNPMPMTIASLPEGRAVDVNDSFIRQMGYRREEIVGRTSLDLGLWVDPSDRHQLMGALLTNGSVRNYEARFRTANGEFRTVLFSAETIDMSGRPHALASFNDITHRKMMEEVLRESDSKFRTIAETAPAGIYIADDRHFVYVNPACERITGYSRHELLELDPLNLAHPDYREMLYAKVQQRLKGKLASERYEIKIITKQGQERSIDLSVGTTTLGGKRVILAIGFDVTEQRSLEVQFRHAQKLHSMGQLASGIAHDFNNLLTVIKGYTDIALSEPGASELRARALGEVMGAADRATALVRQLLQFSRRHSAALQLVNLNEVVHDVERMLRRVLPANINLKVETASQIGQVLADPAQIEHVLINLAVNARDAMPRGGKLTLQTANIVVNHQVTTRNSSLDPGDYVMVTVSDDGSGMAPEIAAHIFDPFFTTKKEGLGLGLSTAFGTVKNSKGHIEVESAPGAGSTFRIYLPRVKRDNALIR
jgi:PAS domain S-box-containing protein